MKVAHPTTQELYDRALAAIQRLKPEGIGCRNDPTNADWAELEFYLAAFPPKSSQANSIRPNDRIQPNGPAASTGRGKSSGEGHERTD